MSETKEYDEVCEQCNGFGCTGGFYCPKKPKKKKLTAEEINKILKDERKH